MLGCVCRSGKRSHQVAHGLRQQNCWRCSSRYLNLIHNLPRGQLVDDHNDDYLGYSVLTGWLSLLSSTSPAAINTKHKISTRLCPVKHRSPKCGNMEQQRAPSRPPFYFPSLCPSSMRHRYYYPTALRSQQTKPSHRIVLRQGMV